MKFKESIQNNSSYLHKKLHGERRIVVWRGIIEKEIRCGSFNSRRRQASSTQHKIVDACALLFNIIQQKPMPYLLKKSPGKSTMPSFSKNFILHFKALNSTTTTTTG
uniref:Uncharacterized protein n=1 Tax=Globodera rostochiensis TaxID=31243 RepID=A0A914HAD4_GLORO